MSKKRLIGAAIVVLFITSMVSIPLYAQAKYPFKSAIVKYQISGSMQSGEQELYIDNYGEKTCTIMNVTVTMGGVTHTTNTMTIASGNDFYNIDISAGTGTKTTVSPEQRKRMMDMVKQMMPSTEEIARVYNKVGTETIFGKPCDIYEYEQMQTKTWLWNNLALKVESKLMGEYRMEAVSLDVDVHIPADQFQPPPGVTIEEEELPVEMPAGFQFGEE